MIDQFLLYDQALLTWIRDNMFPLLPGRTPQLTIATQRKAFAEVTTGQLLNERTLIVPRISVQRLDSVNDPSRFNSNPIRRLGWAYSASGEQRQLIKGKFPTPINIPYQIDMWTRFTKEMNLWERFIFDTFSPQYAYLRIRPNDVWGWKMYIVFLDGPVRNNSDLEPAEEEREIRKTVTLRAECWFFPDTFVIPYVVKRAEIGIYDYDQTSLQYDRSFLPPLELLGVGDGSQQTFSGTLSRPPVLKHTPMIQTVIAGTAEVVADNGSGGWVGARVSAGSLVYSSGVYTITFAAPPDLNEQVTVTYFTDQNP